MDLALMYLSDMSRIRYLWPHFYLICIIFAFSASGFVLCSCTQLMHLVRFVVLPCRKCRLKNTRIIQNQIQGE